MGTTESSFINDKSKMTGVYVNNAKRMRAMPNISLEGSVRGFYV